MLLFYFKFLHVLIAIFLMALIFVGLSSSTFNLRRLHLALCTLLFFASLSGTLLVYPRFTFTTSWIKSAYSLAFISCITLILLIIFKNKLSTASFKKIYLFLLGLFIVITFEAISKHPILFS